MTTQIFAGDHVHFVGDSITNFGWYPGLVNSINATWSAASVRKIATTGSGRRATVRGGARQATIATVSQQKSISVTASGVVGNVVGDITSDMTNRVFNFNPTVIIMECMINDAITATPTPTFNANVASFFSQALAWKPTVRIVWVGGLCYGEQWTHVGPAWNNSQDSRVDQFCATIASACASNGATYIDLRTPALAYEVANNTPEPGAINGFLTSDNVHPNDAAGKPLMCSTTFASLSVVP